MGQEKPVRSAGKKPVKPIPEAMTMGEILQLGGTYQDTGDQALFYFCYLTGARISEALDVTARDIQDKGDYLTVKLITRKNQRVPFREVPIPTTQKERPMLSHIYEYIKGDPGDRIFPGLSRNNAWFRLSRKSIRIRAILLGENREIIRDYVKKINPHYLRHCRLTHLVQHYGYNELRLMRFAGWTNTQPAIVYVHLNWMDLAVAMKQAQNGGIPWV